MSENLEGFLVDLSSDPDQLSRFNKNPDAVVSGSSLTEEERNQVKTRDSRVLADAMGATGFALGEGVGVVTPMRAPARKRPTKKAPPKKKAPAKKKTPARKRAPAKKKTPARKQSPAKRKSPARKKSTARKSPRKTTSRKRR